MSWIQIWKKSKQHLSWKKVDRACDSLCKNYTNTHPLPVKIIALARGGLAPATIIANKLGVRQIYNLGVSSYTSNEDGTGSPGEFNVYQRIPSNITRLTRGEHVLIVDDISDKGTTFKFAAEYLKQNVGGNISTMSIVIKPDTKFIPDFYHKSVNNDTWVVFPWELG